jgi:hypothetical protein
MGQFLAIGLMCKITASKKEMENKEVTIKELRHKMKKTLYYDLSLYEENTSGDYVVFTLKDDVIKDGLIPFLKVFYPAVNPQSPEDYTEVIKFLESTTPDKWIGFADDKREQSFQTDEYASPEFLYFPEEFQKYTRLDFTYIILHLGYGKIITEGIDDLLKFFKYCIPKNFQKHAIAKAVNVYITG